jgi:hypothetical protein
MKAAQIQNNIVVQVIEGSAEWANSKLKGTWIDINGHQISIGYIYISEQNTFIQPKPFNSWALINNVWVAPEPYPNDGNYYLWNEQELAWEIFNIDNL